MSDEERKALYYISLRRKGIPPNGSFIIDNEEITIILNLIEKQSKEIEELKKQLDLDNECEIALNSKIMDLEKEIEELKEQCKEVVCIPEGTCFMLEPKNVDKKWEDKIRAKIEEYKWAVESYDCDEADYKQSQAVGAWNVLRLLLKEREIWNEKKID